MKSKLTRLSDGTSNEIEITSKESALRILTHITGNALAAQKIFSQKKHSGVYLNPNLESFKLEWSA